MRRSFIMLLLVTGVVYGQGAFPVGSRPQMMWEWATGDAGVDLTVDLAHYWNPSGTLSADDQVGSLDGTLGGSLTNDAVNGWDMGTTDANFVTLSGPINNGTNYTIAAWCKPDVTNMDLNVSGGWILSDRTSGMDFQTLYNKADGKYVISVFYSGVSNIRGIGTNAVHGVWQHVAFVVDSDNDVLSAYFDGKLVSSTAFSRTPANVNIGTSRIGMMTTSGNQKWHGSLDQVRFYSAAKTAEFIQAIFDQTSH